MPGRKTGRRVSCGNGGPVESVESQKQASPSFHEPLGNPAKGGGISTFPQLRRRGRMEKWKTKSGFPTFPPPRMYMDLKDKNRAAGGLRPPPGGGRSAPPKS